MVVMCVYGKVVYETKSYETVARKRIQSPEGCRMAILLLCNLLKVEVGRSSKRTSLDG